MINSYISSVNNPIADINKLAYEMIVNILDIYIMEWKDNSKLLCMRYKNTYSNQDGAVDIYIPLHSSIVDILIYDFISNTLVRVNYNRKTGEVVLINEKYKYHIDVISGAIQRVNIFSKLVENGLIDIKDD